MAGRPVTASIAATPVSTAMMLAIVDEARAKQYPSGVIGVRGVPNRDLSADLEHGGQHIRIRPAESALAVREVLGERASTDWLVVVTDRAENDLGAGVLAHFTWQRLRSPDPWEAVRHRFSATGIDPALTTVTNSRELAAGLLAATPAAGWPAAPVGVLTRNHALSAVAATHLDLDRDASDAPTVLRWTLRPQSVDAVATLRHDMGDRLADEAIDWVASRCGLAADPVRALLHRGEMADIVPLGVVLRLLTSDQVRGADLEHQAQLALARLEPRWGTPNPSPGSLKALGSATTGALDDLIHDRRWEKDVDRALAQADAVLGDIRAESLSVYSDVLPQGFRARLVRLAQSLERAATADANSPVWDEVESRVGPRDIPPTGYQRRPAPHSASCSGSARTLAGHRPRAEWRPRRTHPELHGPRRVGRRRRQRRVLRRGRPRARHCLGQSARRGTSAPHSGGAGLRLSARSRHRRGIRATRP